MRTLKWRGRKSVYKTFCITLIDQHTIQVSHILEVEPSIVGSVSKLDEVLDILDKVGDVKDSPELYN